MDKIIFKNGSEVIPIESTDIDTYRGKNSKLISFYCDGCDYVHVNYPIEDVYYTESETYIMCKESVEKLLKED